MSYEPNTTIPWGNIVNNINDQVDLKDKLDTKVDNSQVQTQVPINAIFTDTIYDDTNIVNHSINKSNPHNITKDQINLDLVDNTSDINKPISNSTQVALNTKENNLGNPSTDGLVLMGRSNTNIKEWKTLAEVDKLAKVSINAWGNITGDINNQNDLKFKLEDKEDKLGNPYYNGQVLKSMIDGRRYWDDVVSSSCSSMTDNEIKVAYENNPDTNNYSDNEKQEVALIQSKISSTDYASRTVGGSVKMVVALGKLYMSNDGSDPLV